MTLLPWILSAEYPVMVLMIHYNLYYVKYEFAFSYKT